MTDNKMSKHKAAAEIIDTHRSIWCADGEGLVCLCDDWGVEVHDGPDDPRPDSIGALCCPRRARLVRTRRRWVPGDAAARGDRRGEGADRPGPDPPRTDRAAPGNCCAATASNGCGVNTPTSASATTRAGSAGTCPDAWAEARPTGIHIFTTAGLVAVAVLIRRTTHTFTHPDGRTMTENRYEDTELSES